MMGICTPFFLAFLIAATATASGVRPQDEILVINARRAGTSWCDPVASNRVTCCAYIPGGEGNACRQDVPFSYVAQADPTRHTLFYVHGNRVEDGEALTRGLMVYRTLMRKSDSTPPLRLIIFSWPAERIRGYVRDIRTKACRADVAAFHLAHILARMQPAAPISILGYSYGARVVGGALHLVAGGQLLGHRLHCPVSLPPVSVVLMAAAVHADWMLPGQVQGRALQVTQRMLLINNRCDPAMRYYHLANKRDSTRALGLTGIPCSSKLGSAASRVWRADVCGSVGRNHKLGYYLQSDRVVCLMVDHLFGRNAALLDSGAEAEGPLSPGTAQRVQLRQQ